jgi:cell division GTPase FtsZ
MNTQPPTTLNVVTLRVRAGETPETLCLPAFGEMDAVVIAAEAGAGADTVLRAAEAAWETCVLTFAVAAGEGQNAAPEREALRERVHALILVHGDRLDRAAEGLAGLLRDAFAGAVNLDAADFQGILSHAPGPVHLGIGEARGKDEYEAAVESAARSDLTGTGLVNARRAIVGLKASPGTEMEDVTEAMERLRQLAHPDASMLIGLNYDERLPDAGLRLTVLACDYGPQEA